MTYRARSLALGAILLAAAAQGGTGGSPAKESQAHGRDARPTKARKIFVPYEDLAAVVDPAGRAVLMDRQAFEKLLAAAAKAAAEEERDLGQITQARYTATVQGDKVTLAAQMTLVAMTAECVAVPLAFSQVALTKVELDGQPAPLGYDCGRLVAIVTGKGSHRLRVAGTAVLKELPQGGMHLGLSVPPAVAATMKLDAPGDLGIHATVPCTEGVYDKQTDRTTAELTLGGQSTLAVVLTGNGRREQQQPILLAQSATTVELAPGSVGVDCLQTVQVLRRGVRELRFRLPAAYTVTDVACPNLVRWAVEQPAGGKQLVVRLRTAARGTQALHIQATHAWSAQARWAAPRITLVGAAFQRGYLLVDTGEASCVRGEALGDARREDRACAAGIPGLPAALRGRLYYHWGEAWTVALDLTHVALRRASKGRQTITVTPRHVLLEGRFEITAIASRMFDMELLLPEAKLRWDLTAVTVNGKDRGFTYTLRPDKGGGTLLIELASPVPPEGAAKVELRLQRMPEQWDFSAPDAERGLAVPLLQARCETVSGQVAVSARDDLEAEVLTVPAALKPLTVGRMGTAGLGGDVQSAYTYQAPPAGAISLRVRRRTARVSAESVGLVTVTPRKLTGDWAVTVDVTRACVRKLHLLIARSLGERIDITIPGRRVASRQIVPKPAEPIPEGYNLWRLDLDAPAKGKVVVRARYDRADDEAAPAAGSASITVPLIRPVAERTDEVLAVQAGEELAVEADAQGATPLDAVELPALPVRAERLLAAFRLQSPATPAGAAAAVTLRTTAHERYAIPGALASDGELVTCLGADGAQRTAATFTLANAGLQFLRFRLPAGAALWSVRVGDEQAKPKRLAGKDKSPDYLVSLPRTAEPLRVRIVYAWTPKGGRRGRITLGGVELPDVKVNAVRWRVCPPPGYRITGRSGPAAAPQRERPKLAVTYAGEALASLAAPSFRRAYELRTPAAGQRYFSVVISDLDAPAPEATLEEPADGDEAEHQRHLRARAEEIASLQAQLKDATAQFQRLAKVTRVLREDIAARDEPVGDLEAKVARIRKLKEKITEIQLRLAAEEATRRGRMVAAPKPKGEPKAAPSPAKPAPPRRPPEGDKPADTGVVTLQARGRFTIPVELVAPPRTIRQLLDEQTFAALGPGEITVELTSESRIRSLFAAGLALVAVVGLAMLRRRARAKFRLILLVLVASTLVAAWLPATTHFANGAFLAAVCLIVFYPVWAVACWFGRAMVSMFRGKAPARAGAAAAIALAALVSTAAAQAKKPAPPAKKQPATLIVPYEGHPARAHESDKVLVPYARFVKLWNRAHPEAPIDLPAPSARVSLADARYDVTVTADRATFVLTANVRTYGPDAVQLPLPLGNLAATSAAFAGRAAHLHVGPKGMVLTLPAGQSGKMQVTAVTTPKWLGRRGSLAVSLPPLPAPVMTVRLPQADLLLEADGVDAPPSRPDEKAAEWTIGLGMHRKLALRWAPKVGLGPLGADRTLSAAATHDVYAYHWALVGVSKMAFSFSAGEYERFALLVPEGVTLTDLSGANLKDHRVVGKRQIDGRTFDLLQVDLHRPAAKRYELTARWVAPLGKLPAEMALPLVRAGDVARESGTVALHAAGGMTVQVTKVAGGRKRSTAQGRGDAAASGQARRIAQYTWPYRPFSLALRLWRAEAEVAGKLDQLVRIGTDRLELLVRAALEARGGRLFAASFAPPEGFELISVVGADVGDHYVQKTPEGHRLHVNLRRGVPKTDLSVVLVRKDAELAGAPGAEAVLLEVPHVTLIDPQGAPLAKQEGRLAVQLAASLAASTAASESLRPIAPSATRDWLDAQQVQAVQFAYRYETPGIRLALNVRRRPAKVRVEILAGLHVADTHLAYTYRLRYAIEGSPIDRVSFTLPKAYAPLVAASSPAARSVRHEPAGVDRVRWTVALVNEVTGLLDVAVNFSLPITAETPGIEVPRIQTRAPDGYRAILAVQNFSRHKLAIRRADRLAPLSVSQQKKLLPEQVRKSLQYVYESFTDDWSLGLALTQMAAARRVQAVVDLMDITTAIDPTGRCRYQVHLLLQNRSKQFLRIRMPEGLELWSAIVAQQAVKPVKPQAAGEKAKAGEEAGKEAEAAPGARQVLIPLVKTSPGGLPYEVRLYLAGRVVERFGAITKIRPPAIRVVDMPVMRTTWALRLPAGYRYVRPGGNMSRVAGEIEKMIIAQEARLEQLQRFNESFTEVAGSRSLAGVAAGNWRWLNKEFSRNTKQIDKVLQDNRSQISAGEYGRLQKRLYDQSSSQDSLQGVWARNVERQKIVMQADINPWLNNDAYNGGIAEVSRNSALNGVPAFVVSAAEGQKKQLTEDLKNWRAGQAPGVTHLPAQQDLYIVANGGTLLTDEDQKAGIRKILQDLQVQQQGQFARQERQLKEQLDQLADNRLQRYFIRLPAQPAPRPTTPTPLARSGFRGEAAGTTAQPEGPRTSLRIVGGDETGTRAGHGLLGPSVQFPDVGGGKGRRRTFVTADASASMVEPGAVAGEEAGIYIAGGTLSLPVELPAGERELHFACPSGAPELTLWVVRDDLAGAGMATGVAAAALVVLFVLGRFARLLFGRRSAQRAAR